MGRVWDKRNKEKRIIKDYKNKAKKVSSFDTNVLSSFNNNGKFLKGSKGKLRG